MRQAPYSRVSLALIHPATVLAQVEGGVGGLRKQGP
jgi:hypothetical protein